MDYLNKVLENQELVELALEILAIVVGLVWSWAKTKGYLKDKKDSKIMAIVEQAAQQVYDEFVRNIKYGQDGKRRDKLSSVQIKQARNKAWEKAVAIAKAEGITLAKEVAKEVWPIILDRAINGIKTKDHAKA